MYIYTYTGIGDGNLLGTEEEERALLLRAYTGVEFGACLSCAGCIEYIAGIKFCLVVSMGYQLSHLLKIHVVK